jgi:Elongation factor G, domain IV
MNIYDDWYEKLIKRTGLKWRDSIQTQGESKRSGPRAWFAEVSLEFSPSDGFEVANMLEPDLVQRAQNEGWYDFITYGVLDIFLVTSMQPIKNFKLTILKIVYNEIDSSAMAFRLAARDAALKALEIHNKSS